MNRTLIVLALPLLAASASAQFELHQFRADALVEKAKAQGIAAFAGTYRGFTPSDASPVRVGEIELEVTEKDLFVRIATGDRVLKDMVSTKGTRVMSREEIAAIYSEPGSFRDRTVGFETSGGIKLYFLRDAQKDEFALIVRGMLGDVLGPTLLISPAQIARGELSDFFDHVGGDRLPRVSNGGKPLR
jgi:hypothetical protein